MVKCALSTDTNKRLYNKKQAFLKREAIQYIDIGWKPNIVKNKILRDAMSKEYARRLCLEIMTYNQAKVKKYIKKKNISTLSWQQLEKINNLLKKNTYRRKTRRRRRFKKTRKRKYKGGVKKKKKNKSAEEHDSKVWPKWAQERYRLLYSQAETAAVPAAVAGGGGGEEVPEIDEEELDRYLYELGNDAALDQHYATFIPGWSEKKNYMLSRLLPYYNSIIRELDSKEILALIAKILVNKQYSNSPLLAQIAFGISLHDIQKKGAENWRQQKNNYETQRRDILHARVEEALALLQQDDSAAAAVAAAAAAAGGGGGGAAVSGEVPLGRTSNIVSAIQKTGRATFP